MVNCVALTFSEQGLGREWVVWGKGLCVWWCVFRGGGLNALNSEVDFYVSKELLGSQLQFCSKIFPAVNSNFILT